MLLHSDLLKAHFAIFLDKRQKDKILQLSIAWENEFISTFRSWQLIKSEASPSVSSLKPQPLAFKWLPGPLLLMIPKFLAWDYRNLVMSYISSLYICSQELNQADCEWDGIMNATQKRKKISPFPPDGRIEPMWASSIETAFLRQIFST